MATDIAAMGIDVEGLSYVINFDLPDVPETYVHRIGRTGRAGATGVAVSFCDEEERECLMHIEKVTSKSIPVIEDHPYPLSNSSIVITTSSMVKNKDDRKKAFAKKNNQASYLKKSKKKG